MSRSFSADITYPQHFIAAVYTHQAKIMCYKLSLTSAIVCCLLLTVAGQYRKFTFAFIYVAATLLPNIHRTICLHNIYEQSQRHGLRL